MDSISAFARTNKLARSLAMLGALWTTTTLVGAQAEAAKDSLVSKPPLARSVDTLMFDKPLPDGRNALLVMDFNGAYPPDANGKVQKPPKQLTLRTETGRVQLNDSGLYGDARAGDGILSGVAKVNRKRHDADIEAYLTRARSKDAASAPLFNLRERVGEKAFDLRNPLEGRGEPRELRFNLPPFGDVRVIATPLPHLPLALPPTTDPMKTLMITDTSVLRDATFTYSPCKADGTLAPDGLISGPWSFQTLVGNMSGSTNPAVRQQFISKWLQTWVDGALAGTVKHSATQTGQFQILGRPALIAAISSLQVPPWDPNNPATLDIAKLPFQLRAIVNRIDLAGQSAYGPTGTAELRFIFGLLEKQGSTCVPATPALSLILEYAVPPTDCVGLKTLANTWIALDSLTLGGGPYKAVLKSLTDQVTLINANPLALNGSAISQVRSNEVKLGFPWELREWRLDGPQTTAQLMPATVKNTPDPSFNFTPVMNTLPAMGPVPSTVVASSNLYGPGSNPPNPPWDGSPAMQPLHRFLVSNGTCSGCHLSETNTNFTMLTVNGPLSAPAQLAGFLTGITVTDPINGPLSHTFNDLDRRGVLLDQIAANSCTRLPGLPNLQSPSQFATPQLLRHLSAFSSVDVH